MLLEKSEVAKQSKVFALRIIETYKVLCDQRHEYIMSKQMLRSGTSIGANVTEAHYAQSRPDFISKMSIALKEAAETTYWLELLNGSGYLSDYEFGEANDSCMSIVKMLTSIVKNTKENNC